jgi:mannosyltransferase OCH1-like enzyme
MQKIEHGPYSFLKNGVFPDKVPSDRNMIPRKIWQTCKDRNSMQSQLVDCVSALKKMNPSWTHTLFDDETQYEFIKAVCSKRFLEAYERIHPLFGAARADLFRYLIVFFAWRGIFRLKKWDILPT